MKIKKFADDKYFITRQNWFVPEFYSQAGDTWVQKGAWVWSNCCFDTQKEAEDLFDKLKMLEKPITVKSEDGWFAKIIRGAFNKLLKCLGELFRGL